MPTVAELLNPASSNPPPAAPAAAGGANPFDQFDTASANPFDQFDAAKGSSPAAQPKTLARGAGLGARAIVEGAASIPDIPANLAIGATNLLYAPIGAVVKAAGGTPEKPLAYSPFRTEASALADLAGLPKPQDKAERVQQAIAEGVTAAMGGNLAAGALKAAPGVTGAVASTLAEAPVTQTIAGAAGGGASQEVAEHGGGPLAQFGAGTVAAMLAGGVAPRFTGEAPVPVPAAAPKPNPVARALAPFTSAVSPKAARAEASAVLRESATNPDAAAQALEQPGELVPGSQPTTYQQSGDVGLGQLERQAMTRDAAPFLQRAEQQNTARRDALAGVQTGGDVNDLVGAVKGQLDALDTAHQSMIDKLTERAQEKADAAVGPEVPDDERGVILRDRLNQADEAFRAQEASLWNAVDPEGKMTANTLATSQAAKEVAGQMSPVAKPMGREESAIFEAAQTLPPLAPLRDLIALRSRLSEEMRNELSQNGRTVAYARMSALREAMQDNLAHTISQEIVNQHPLVIQGVISGEQSLANRLQALWESQNVVSDAAAQGTLEPRGNPGLGAPGNSGGATPPVSGVRGAAVHPDQRPGGLEGNPGVPTQAERAVAERDVAASREPSPNSLFAVVKKAGGVRLRDAQGFPVAGPDVEAALQDVRYPGLVNNASGMAPERLAQALADNGWFGRGVGDPSAAFEAAMAREARGSKVFHPDDLSAVQKQINDRLDREMQAAGVTARDSRAAAADKLARYRAAQRELADIQARSGIPGAHEMSPEELLGDLQERAAIRGEAPPEEDAHGAEFDRLSTTREKPTVDEGASQRLEAATDFTKLRASIYGKGPVGDVLRRGEMSSEFTTKDGYVARKFFHPGSTGFSDMQALFRAAPDAAEVIERYAATTLRRAALKADGTLDLARYEKWRTEYRDALRALPPSLKSKFDTAARAGDAVVQAVEAKTLALKEAQRGAFGKIMGLTEPDDVVKTVGQVLAGRTAVADMKRLARATAGDQLARDGLRRAVVDHIAREFVGNTEAGTSGLSQIKSDAYQTFIRKNRAALHLVFTPAEVQSMEAVAADLQRAARTQNSKLPGQSNTAQDLKGHKIAAEVAKRVGNSWMEIVGGLVGSAGGHLGTIAGVAGGAAVHGLTASLRAAGMRRIDDLVSEAMLNPSLARELLKPAPKTPGNFNTGAAALGAALWASTQPKRDQRR